MTNQDDDNGDRIPDKNAMGKSADVDILVTDRIKKWQVTATQHFLIQVKLDKPERYYLRIISG